MTDNKPSMARINLEIPKSKWFSEIFDKYPDVELEVLNFLPFDFEKSIGNAIIEINHYKIDKIIEEIKKHKSVFEFNLIEKELNRAKFNVKTKNPHLLFKLIECGVLINYPVKVKEKVAEWNLIATRERINNLFNCFEDNEIKFSLIRIGNSFSNEEDKNKIDLEEKKILKTAINLGFFDVPRKISLEELAKNLGLSKSWTSEKLRKIINKRIKIGI
ncbi:MAG: helix-turn-helix domain-containing protein [Candidatus Hodarchaeota archaeon]